MSEKRELVLKAFRGESVDRVPVGFWHHFTTEDEWLYGFENPEIIDKNKAGHKKFIEEARKNIKIDFVKVKGHSNDKYNDRADALAKTACGIYIK